MNAKQELLEKLLGKPLVKCAELYTEDWGDDGEIKNFIRLKVNYTSDEFDEFIKSLDFDYDNGYGGQNLFGYVWFNDGSWLDRGEYDGSEWWQYQTTPKIPNELIKEAETNNS
jgi:hypothetical protein